MNTLQRLKKSKKGFTLVELLVVLVILAILAAAIIPSMMGFIDKAKQESHAAECRSVLLAADVVMNEQYGAGKSPITITATDIQNIAEVPGTVGETVTVKDYTGKDNATHYYISELTYTTTDKVVYTYKAADQNGGTWTRS
jgi:type IV pilus assembly protein PilA